MIHNVKKFSDELVVLLDGTMRQAEKQEQCKEHGECFGGKCIYTTPPAAPVQDERDWSLLEATQESLREHMAEIKRLKAIIEQAEKQEPFGYFQYAIHFDAWVQNRDSNTGVAFYTTPPAAQRKEWQRLTDDEIKEIIGSWAETPIKGYTRKLFDQIEAKLKEKNT